MKVRAGKKIAESFSQQAHQRIICVFQRTYARRDVTYAEEETSRSRFSSSIRAQRIEMTTDRCVVVKHNLKEPNLRFISLIQVRNGWRFDIKSKEWSSRVPSSGSQSLYGMYDSIVIILILQLVHGIWTGCYLDPSNPPCETPVGYDLFSHRRRSIPKTFVTVRTLETLCVF